MAPPIIPANSVMLDVEAFDDTCVAVGMVLFDDRFIPRDQVEVWHTPTTLTSSRKCLQWWASHGHLLHGIRSHEDVAPIRSKLHRFLDPIRDPWLWAAPTQFDVPLLWSFMEGALGGSRFNLQRKRCIDCRSFLMACGVDKLPHVERDPTTHHTPVADCLHQIACLREALANG